MATAARCACLVLLLSAGACHRVLELEDAEVDPSLGSSQSEPSELDDGGAPPVEAGPAPVELGTCELYCQTITQTCTGLFAQYTTYDGCLGVCQRLPLGMDGDSSGNTAFCRLQAASQAPIEPSFYCPVAGPGGNDVCGTNCEGLCSLVSALCSEELDDDDDEPVDCMASCAGLDDKKTYSVSPEAALFKGKHLQCRLYHASVAAEADPEQHCQHALGGSPCN